MSDWQPIETAPKNQLVLLFAWNAARDNWRMGTGFWSAANADAEPWNWEGRWLSPWEDRPTHWQPLPTPPEASR